jgi:AAA domain
MIEPGLDWGDLTPAQRDLAAVERQLAKHPPEEAVAIREATWADEPAADPLPPGQAAELEAAMRDDRPLALLERRGPSYRVTCPEVGLVMTFRDVRTSGELTADVSIDMNGRHLFRTTTMLSITSRDKLAKTAAEFSGGDAKQIRRGVFAIVEAVLAAEDEVDAPVDLRFGSLALPAGGLHVWRPLWPAGSMHLVSPGDAGKSTIARAAAVSIAGGLAVIPGIEAVGDPRPVLYVAGEDPVAYWHARSVEAICRGIGIDRSSLAQPIELFDARGRPLHRIVRAIAERAADFGCIILDSQQALLPQADASGGIRDRDSLFWSALDQLEQPTFIIAHPNRADARAGRRPMAGWRARRSTGTGFGWPGGRNGVTNRPWSVRRSGATP